MRKLGKGLLVVLMSLCLVTSMSGCGKSAAKTDKAQTEKKETAKTVKLDPDNPTTVTIWNYYNGDQLAAFEDLVAEFNETVGAKEGIVVVSVSQGSIDNLASSLMDAVNGKTGAQDVPTMASIYPESGYELEKMGKLATLDDYFTKEELEQYVSGFVDEGKMTKDGELVLFPVSKSTECFAVNTTDCANFEKVCNVSIEDITTVEELTKVAKLYYDWTDSLTKDVPDDGKAFYGRDSVSNYVYIGAKQLGHELFQVTADGVTADLDKATFQKLWDNYYIPYVNGYFAEDASYRSEDMKTAKIMSLTGSTSGVSYLPTAVTDENDDTHEITIAIQPALTFEGAVSSTYVQQGAGYCVMKSSEEEQYAAVTFLKWFTDAKRNLDFSVLSGYSPVTMKANDKEAIKEQFSDTKDVEKSKNIMTALLISADIFTHKETYTCKPFDASKDVRDLLADAFEKTAKDDRAAVLEQMKSGKSREEALSKYISQEYFDQWYSNLCDAVNKKVNQ